MPFKRQHLTSLLLIAGSLSAQAGTPPVPEECFPQLREIIEQARTDSPAMRQKQASSDEGKALIDSARSQTHPRVSGTLRMQSAYTKRIDSEYRNSEKFKTAPSASLYASVPLFHWGEYDAKIDQAKARKNAQDDYGEDKYQDIVQNLRRYYVEYQLAMLSRDLADDGIEYANWRRQNLDGLADNGMGSRQDALNADIYTEERLDDQAYAKNQAEYYQDLLQENSGNLNLRIRKEAMPEFDFLKPDELARLLNQADSADLPIFRALDDELRTAKAQYDEIRVRNRPKVDAVAYFNLDQEDEYRSSTHSYKTLPRVYAWGGIQANWAIYDGGTVTADKLAAMARMKNVQARIDEARLRQNRETANIARDAELNASRYQTRLRRTELLQTSIDMMEKQPDSFSSDTILQRKLDLLRTRLDLARAGAYYMLDVAQLRDLAAYNSKK